ETIHHSFGFDTPVIVRTSEEMRNIIAINPFLKEKDIDSTKLHVTFLSETARKNSLKNLEALSSGPDRFYAAPHEIYLYCPGGYGENQALQQCSRKGAVG